MIVFIIERYTTSTDETADKNLKEDERGGEYSTHD
jgi:hypothetical protein